MATALKLEYTTADLLSAAATVFIAASRDGVKLQVAREAGDEDAA